MNKILTVIQILVIYFILLKSKFIASKEINCALPPPNMDIRDCCPIPDIISDKLGANCTEFQRGSGKFSLSPCFVECIFNATNIFDHDREIHQTNIRTFLSKVLENSQEFLPIMEIAFEKCSSEVKDVLDKRGPPSSIHHYLQHDMCSPYSTMMVACVQAETFINCPGDKWRNDFVCNNANDFLKKCATFSNDLDKEN
ncbi:general odorant-binding protein 66 [Condylostylus longicornis]|uniref:general odorant-binding protein 66 n=1 Tax=Condylostylus longicornis TaxID=2530218 RepID=UPI00244DB311|nr:general odorant-binding protein 66 [Condylostylus longicornis]